MASGDTDMPPYTNTVTEHAYTLLSTRNPLKSPVPDPVFDPF